MALSKREDPDAKELIRRMEFILRNLPPWITVEDKKRLPGTTVPTWKAGTLKVQMYHKNKERSTFQSMTASRDSGRSFTANVVILDEWAFQQWAWEIYAAAYPTINRPTGGQVIGISTAARGTLFEYIWDQAVKGENTFNAIFLPWNADPRRTQEWYEQTKKDLPNSYKAEYPSTPEEAFSAAEGHAFPEFTQSIHVCQPFEIPEHWRKWRSNDPGYSDPYAWHWYAVNEDGQVFVYREFTRTKDDPRLTYSDQAREVARRSRTIDPGDGTSEPEKIMFTVVGRDAFTQHPETGKAIVDYYWEGGSLGALIPPPKQARTDRIHRKAVVHEYLKPYVDENTGKPTAKVQIFTNCTQLIETLPKLLEDKWSAEKVADSSIDHWYDSFGMGLIAHHAQQSTAPAEKDPPIRAHKKKKIKALTRRRRKLA